MTSKQYSILPWAHKFRTLCQKLGNDPNAIVESFLVYCYEKEQQANDLWEEEISQ